MSLDFLTPATSDGPAARSPLANAVAAAGARTELRDGWEVPMSFGDPAAERAACAESVGFADVSHLTKLELQGAPDAIGAALGAEAPAEESSSGSVLGLARREDDVWRCPLTPSRALLLAEPAHGEALPRGLAGGDLRTCDLTGAWGALAITGPLTRDLFARFCALDLREAVLPVRGFRPGSVARTPGYVLREDVDRFLMLFGAAFGAYVWEVVADAAEGLGGRPVGLDALPALERAVSGGEAARA